MNGSFTIIIIIVNINNMRMIKIIEGSGGEWIVNLRFSSVPLHPLKPLTTKNVNQYSWSNFFIEECFLGICYSYWSCYDDGYMGVQFAL